MGPEGHLFQMPLQYRYTQVSALLANICYGRSCDSSHLLPTFLPPTFLCYHTTNVLSIRFLLVFCGNSHLLLPVCFLRQELHLIMFILQCQLEVYSYYSAPSFVLFSSTQASKPCFHPRISYLPSVCDRNYILSCFIPRVNW
jgi:hypothetical protein